MDSGWALLIAILGALTGVGTVLVSFFKSRGENKAALTNSKAVLDARIDARVETQLAKAWDSIDKLEKGKIEQDTKLEDLEKRETRRTGAITRILRDIAKQWPNSDGPNLNPADIDEISETIPSAWIRPKPASKQT